MTCPMGKTVHYMFTGHTLEDRTDTCVTASKCVDYVHVTFPNSIDEEKTCGQEPALNTLFADGHSGVFVEFYANRYEQAAGFSMDVKCCDPGVSPSRKRRQTSESVECSLVSNAERPTVDGEAQLVSFSCIITGS